MNPGLIYKIVESNGMRVDIVNFVPIIAISRSQARTGNKEQNMAENEYLDSTKARRWRSVGSKKLRYLLAYLLQVDSLSELDQGDVPLTITRHLRRTDILRPDDSQKLYVELFRRYRGEWRGFLDRARRNGCEWASRIDLPNPAA